MSTLAPDPTHLARRVLALAPHHRHAALALVGLITLAFAAMIAVPLTAPAPLKSISQIGQARSTVPHLPQLQRFSARDGTVLGYRHYAPATVSHRSASRS